MTKKLKDNLYELSEESIKIYNSIEELCYGIFNDESFLTRYKKIKKKQYSYI